MHPLLELFGFFVGVALCFWRTRTARSHFVLYGVAATVWDGLLLLEPQTHTPMFGIATIMCFVLGLSSRHTGVFFD